MVTARATTTTLKSVGRLAGGERRRSVHSFRSCLGRGTTLARHPQTWNCAGVWRLASGRDAQAGWWPGSRRSGVVVRTSARQLSSARRRLGGEEQRGQTEPQRLLGATIIPRSRLPTRRNRSCVSLLTCQASNVRPSCMASSRWASK